MDRILLVDDDLIVTKLIASSIFKRLGIVCDCAASYHEGMGLLDLNAGDYMLAIVDFNLPDAAEGEMVDYSLSKGVAPLVLTEAYDNDTRTRILSRNVVDYIVKRDIKELDYLESVVRRLTVNRTVKVLVVDDSLVYRQSMSQLLRSQLLTVFQATNGREALNVIDEHPDIRMVITDYQMPTMDGLELLGQLRKHYKKDSMSIIITAGMRGVAIIPQFLKAGANDYLLKPYSTEEFVCRINANLEILQMIQTLKERAQTDPLTGLYNRRHLFEAGTAFHATAKRCCLSICAILLDIDHFKNINDTYGHEAGDLMLKLVADAVHGHFQRRTDVVARYGGEEFCIISSFDDREKLGDFVESLRLAVSALSLPYGDHELSVTVSAGVATTKTDTFEELVRLADDMLYQAKEKGRNRVCLA